MSTNILTESSNRIATIQINRLDKRNALTADMYQGMADALHAAEADSAIRVILIKGSADCFCAGNDLKDFLEKPPHDDDSPVFQFLLAISKAAKPIVAAVGGPAVGIGTTMLLHCDLVYASSEARFQLPFVPLGITPEAASSLLLPMSAGFARAAELLLLGQAFDAAKAHEVGIVTQVLDKAELLDKAHAVAAQLAALPPTSVRLTKSLMRKPHAQLVQEHMHLESLTFRRLLNAPEAKEAMAAFFEKRKPDFSRF